MQGRCLAHCGAIHLDPYGRHVCEYVRAAWVSIQVLFTEGCACQGYTVLILLFGEVSHAGQLQLWLPPKLTDIKVCTGALCDAFVWGDQQAAGDQGTASRLSVPGRARSQQAFASLAHGVLRTCALA